MSNNDTKLLYSCRKKKLFFWVELLLATGMFFCEGILVPLGHHWYNEGMCVIYYTNYIGVARIYDLDRGFSTANVNRFLLVLRLKLLLSVYFTLLSYFMFA